MNNRIFPILSILLFVVILNTFFVSAQGNHGPAPYIKDVFATEHGGAEPVNIASPGDLLIINVKMGNLGLEPSVGLLSIYQRIDLGIAEEESEDIIYFENGNFPIEDGWEPISDGETFIDPGFWEIEPIIWNDVESIYEIPFEVPDAPEGATIELGAELAPLGPDENPGDNSGTTSLTVSLGAVPTVTFNTPINGASYTVGDTINVDIDVSLPDGYWMNSSINPVINITGQPTTTLGHYGGLQCDGVTRTCGYYHT